MEAIFLKLLNMSITAGWLVLAVLLLRLALRRAPRAILCVLWALVGLRLIFPFSLESAFSLIPSAETIPQDILETSTPSVQTGIPVLNQAVNGALADAFTPSAARPPVSIGTADAAQSAVQSAVQSGTQTAAPAQAFTLESLTHIAAVVWLIGMIAMLGYAAVSYLRLRRQVAASLPTEDGLWLCDDIDTPFILGFFRPRIYLPSSLKEEQRPHVVAHERAHLRRHDHWWKPIGYALLSVYWFHPLLWVAYILLCRDIELACDEKVIRDMGVEEKKSYSVALLESSMPRRMIAACPLAFGEVNVKSRIRSVLNYKKPAFWLALLAAAACIVAAACLLTDPFDRQTDLLGSEYKVTKVLYATQDHSTAPADYPAFCLDADLYLHVNDGEKWTLVDGKRAGDLSPNRTLKDHMQYEDGWTGSKRVGEIMHAFTFITADQSFYMIMQTKAGETLLAGGWWDVSEEGQGASDDTAIHYLCLLESQLKEGSFNVNFFARSLDHRFDGDVMPFAYWSDARKPGYAVVGFLSGEGEQQADKPDIGFAVFRAEDGGYLLKDTQIYPGAAKTDSGIVMSSPPAVLGDKATNANSYDVILSANEKLHSVRQVFFKDDTQIGENKYLADSSFSMLMLPWDACPDANRVSLYFHDEDGNHIDPDTGVITAPDGTVVYTPEDTTAGIPDLTASHALVRSGGATVAPYLYETASGRWVNGMMAVADMAQPDGNTILQLGDAVPTLTLDRDFLITRAEDVYFDYGFTLYDAAGAQVTREGYFYGDTVIRWLEPGRYYLTFGLSVQGTYIPEVDRNEYTRYQAIVALEVPENGPQPAVPDAISNITAAELWINGKSFPADAADLPALEKLLSDTEPMGFPPACPFSSVLYLTRADGTVLSLCHAEDSCDAFCVNGEYYTYNGNGEDFWRLFPISDPSKPTEPAPDPLAERTLDAFRTTDQVTVELDYASRNMRLAMTLDKNDPLLTSLFTTLSQSYAWEDTGRSNPIATDPWGDPELEYFLRIYDPENDTTGISFYAGSELVNPSGAAGENNLRLTLLPAESRTNAAQTVYDWFLAGTPGRTVTLFYGGMTLDITGAANLQPHYVTYEDHHFLSMNWMPDAQITVRDAGMYEAYVTAYGEKQDAYPQWGICLLGNTLDKIRFSDDMDRTFAITEEMDGICHLESSLWALRFDGPIDTLFSDVTTYEVGSWTTAIPKVYEPMLKIQTNAESYVGGENLLVVREKASVEAAIADMGSSDGSGYLFGITAMDQAAFEAYLRYDYPGCDVFAKDDAGNYFCMTYATDVQLYRSGGIFTKEDLAMWEQLNALGAKVCADFITRNGLTQYNRAEARSMEFLYDGKHVYIEFYPYYTFDGSTAEAYTLVLSQPAGQGDGGIWCVEQQIDLYGRPYFCYPAQDVPAAEYYAALQAECDAGQHPELLTPMGAAKAWAAVEWSHITLADGSFQYAYAIASDYIAANVQMHEVIPSLLTGRDVEDAAILEMLEKWGSRTWGVLGRNYYGSDWWTPLNEALRMVATGEDQAYRDRCMMSFYRYCYGRYAEAVAECLRWQYLEDPTVFAEVLSQFDKSDQALIEAALQS